MGKIFGWEWSLITDNVLEENNVGGGRFWRTRGKRKGQAKDKVLNSKARVWIDTRQNLLVLLRDWKVEQATEKARKSSTENERMWHPFLNGLGVPT